VGHRHPGLVGNRDRDDIRRAPRLVTTVLLASGHWFNLSQPVLASSLALFGGVAISTSWKGERSAR